MTGIPCARASSRMGSRSRGWPKRCTGRMALVRDVMHFSMPPASRLYVSGSTSPKTGRAPVNRMGLAEAMHESGVVMTSSPGPTPSAASTTWSAVVPEVVATAWPVPQSWAKAASSSRTLAPWVIQPLAATAWTAAISASPISGLATGMRQAISPPGPRRARAPPARRRLRPGPCPRAGSCRATPGAPRRADAGRSRRAAACGRGGRRAVSPRRDR